MEMHKLLARQLNKLRRQNPNVEPDIRQLLKLVSDAYYDFDSLVTRSNHSLVTMSNELSSANRALKAEASELRDRYQYVIEGADVGIWDWDCENDQILFNETGAAIYGLDRTVGRISAADVFELLTPQSVDELQHSLNEHFKNPQRIFEVRVQVNVDTPTPVWALVRGNTVLQDTVTGECKRMVGTLVNIEDQVAYERGLEQMNKLSNSSSLSLTDKCNQILDIGNNIFKTSSGRINEISGDTYTIRYCRDTEFNFNVGDRLKLSNSLCAFCLGANVGISINNAKAEGYGDILACAKLGIESYIGAEIWVGGKSFGTVCFASTSVNEFSQIHRNLVHLIAKWLGQELDRDKREQELTLAHAEALRANAIKSEFLATMSHEIRTPLNGITGIAQILMGSELNQREQSNLQALKRSCDSLLNVINDVLDFSKIEAGKLELEHQTFELNIAVVDTINLFKASAEDKGIELVAYCDSDVPILVRGDVGRLKQILNNLLSNAIKFTDKSDVSLAVECDNSDSQTSTKTVKFIVSDSGVGIAEEQLGHIFDKFTQADSSTTRRFGGTGLGLAITRQLTELMCGNILVESELGVGSRFTVTIPFELGDANDMIGLDTDPLQSQKLFTHSPSVLLVEDNPVNQMIARTMLTDLGCEVTVANDGHEAVQTALAAEFGIIFMDMQMPEMDGLIATTRIRQHAAYESTPIIALTASALAEDRRKCLAAGMDDYLSKPFQKSDLARMLKAYLDA